MLYDMYMPENLEFHRLLHYHYNIRHISAISYRSIVLYLKLCTMTILYGTYFPIKLI